MKKLSCFLVVLGLLLVSSCSLKAPIPENQANGIVAIPMHAANLSGSGFTFTYKLISSFDPGISITIYPQVGYSFAFSQELPPGKYYFDKIRVIHGAIRSISNTSSKPRNLHRPIIVNVQPGTVTIAHEKLSIEVVRDISEEDSTITHWRFQKMTDSEMQRYIDMFKSLGNSDQWLMSEME